MSKDPAVLFYTSDFLTGTAFFTMEQIGQYITLLCLQHQHGVIPENHMISVCGSFDNPVMSKFIKDDQGNFYNERMKIESEKRKSFCKSRSNNKSGRPKKDIKNNHKKITSKSYDNRKIIHMENENENENININDKFNLFWKAYPKKKAKQDAEKAFLKLNPDVELLQTMLSSINTAKTTEDWLKEKGKFIPYPATWLDGKRWTDEENELHPLAGTVSDKTIRTVEMLDDWRPPA